jgi:hypothetical protein
METAATVVYEESIVHDFRDNSDVTRLDSESFKT